MRGLSSFTNMNVQTPKRSLPMKRKGPRQFEVDEEDSYTSTIVEDYYCKLYFEKYYSAISLDSRMFQSA